MSEQAQPAVLLLDGWAGRERHRVTVIGETPKRYRVRLLDDTRLPAGQRKAGDVVLVPRHAVRPAATSPTVNFAICCPHCGRDLEGERITLISWPSLWRTFFYTESDHQLAYRGAQLEGVSCLETEESRG